jgi:hypothetical protein
MANTNHLKHIGTLATGLGFTVAGVGLLLQVPAINSACSEVLQREDVRDLLSNGAKRGCEFAIDYLTRPRSLQA